MFNWELNVACPLSLDTQPSTPETTPGAEGSLSARVEIHCRAASEGDRTQLIAFSQKPNAHFRQRRSLHSDSRKSSACSGSRSSN